MSQLEPAERRVGSRRLAAIDIGSNSVRLVVAESLGGDYRVLDEEREATRLASSLTSERRLSERALRATLDALRRFKKIAEGYGVSQLRTIATCAVREAENGPDFVHQADAELGLTIEVIPAEVEAQLAFKSVERAFNLTDKTAVVIDMGGGSTEIVLAVGGHIEMIESTPLGAVRMTELHGPEERLFAPDTKTLLTAIEGEVKRYVKRPLVKPQIAFGTGGTFTTLASMLIADRRQGGQSEWGYRVTRADVRHLVDRLASLSAKERRDVPGLSADRADIIVAALAVIDALLERLDVNLLQVHTGGVRDGLLLTMLEEAADQPRDREAAVRQFAVSCGVELRHAEQVARLAGQLFDQIAERGELRPRDREILTTAALLRDVGYLISYKKHHKHSYQLILNSQLPGISREELELIAHVARYHRGARPKKKKHPDYGRLSKGDRRRVKRLAGLLRIAGGLDRGHNQSVAEARLRLSDEQADLSVVSRSDAEVELWSARRRGELFERAFGMRLVVREQ